MNFVFVNKLITMENINFQCINDIKDDDERLLNKMIELNDDHHTLSSQEKNKVQIIYKKYCDSIELSGFESMILVSYFNEYKNRYIDNNINRNTVARIRERDLLINNAMDKKCSYAFYYKAQLCGQKNHDKYLLIALNMLNPHAIIYLYRKDIYCNIETYGYLMYFYFNDDQKYPFTIRYNIDNTYGDLICIFESTNCSLIQEDDDIVINTQMLKKNKRKDIIMYKLAMAGYDNALVYLTKKYTEENKSTEYIELMYNAVKQGNLRAIIELTEKTEFSIPQNIIEDCFERILKNNTAIHLSDTDDDYNSDKTTKKMSIFAQQFLPWINTKLKKQQDEIEELQNTLIYAPGGQGAKQCEENFNNSVDKL